MSRMTDAQNKVISFHERLEAEMKLPPLEINCDKRLKQLLERIYRFEMKCSLKKIRYSENLCIEFRGAIADLILLLENFDIQRAVANRSVESTTKSAETKPAENVA